jgi:AcrR family transcriptional regulator
LRHTVDVEALAHRISGSMLGIGIGVHHRGRRPERISTVQCRMMLRGLAVSDPGETPLARCRAREAADLAIRSWSETPRLGSDERAKHVLAVARSEFARRGYDLTTIRDIAAAAAMSTGAIRRVSGSKGNLMMMIMGAYAENVTNGWRSILTSPSTSVEKLDALLWFDTNVVHEFPEEQRIQSMGLQVAPPTSPNLMATFPTQLRLLKAFLAEGSDTRQLQVGGGPKDIAARCLFRLVWPSHSMTETVGTQGTHLFEREMLVRGAALRF